MTTAGARSSRSSAATVTRVGNAAEKFSAQVGNAREKFFRKGSHGREKRQPSRVRPFLGPPGAREGSNGGWRDPERIDDPPVLETPLGASSAKQVIGDVEASRR